MHGCVIGFSSLLSLNICEMECYTAKVIELLLNISSYPNPIGDNVKRIINIWKKMNQDNLNRCEEKMSESQFDLLKETLVSSNYFS